MTHYPLPAQLAAQAESVVNNLRETQYAYQQNIDADNGIYDCDCNSFLALILEGLAPSHYAQVPMESTQPRPRAFEYYNFFSTLTAHSSGGWHQVDIMQNARRGDILAWRAAAIEKGKDTGHVVFLAETPEVDESDIFTVRVYDSADKPHFDDTRGTGSGQFANGVGSGYLKFQVDTAGHPIAFLFSPSSPSFEARQIAIGRAKPLSD